MIQTYYFSASGTTERVAGVVESGLGYPFRRHNLTVAGFDESIAPTAEDIAIFATPVYNGRLPSIAADKFRLVKGSGQKCIAVVVYGNRDYEDALLELCDLLDENGFKVIGAGAFIARHCIFPEVAAARPDKDDIDKISLFAEQVKELLKSDKTLDLSSIKGNRPYKTPGAVSFQPVTDKDKCTQCGRCVKECPTNAIYMNDAPVTDIQKCITCTRCIHVCPNEARLFIDPTYQAAAPKFKAMNGTRREPVWFLAQ